MIVVVVVLRVLLVLINMTACLPVSSFEAYTSCCRGWQPFIPAVAKVGGLYQLLSRSAAI